MIPLGADQMAMDIGRRQFISGLGGAAVAWPLAARAQQPAMPVVGFVNAASPQGFSRELAAFLKGLDESGYVEGRNVAIEYRWAEGRIDRLPAMASDLVRRQVAVIAATTTAAALAAKAATTTIPIVFETAADPIQLGLVASLSRPEGNVTGVTQTNVETAPKRLELLHELVPNAHVMGLLVDPADPILADSQTKDFLSAARTLGVELHVLNASAERDFDAVFANLIQLQAGGLVISTGPFFTGHSEQLAAMAASHAMPAVYKGREFAAAGGLLSYGSATSESYRLAGNYTGRILKGDKAADLPVQQATKVELYINLKAAKALSITFPLSLLGRADEVIE
jgi:putative tryptophan/tyrosine transport system substrate-binding protein